jgi:hypothetical protein
MMNSAAPPDSSDTGHQWPRLRMREVLLIFLVFFALAGDPAPHQNEPYYLCRLKHFWNPAWCASDFFLDSADAHLTFVWTFGWLTKWLSLPATAWAGRVFVWGLLAWAWQRLSWRVVPKPFFAVLSAAIWVVLIDQANLAGEWVVGGFESKCVAYVFVLLALYELTNQRWNRVWPLLGAASAFHVLVGGWSVLVCGGVWTLSRRRGEAPSLPSMLPYLITGGLLALFGVVPALQLTWHQSPKLVGVADEIYVFDRLPHHLAILSVPADEVIHRLTRHGLLLVALGILALANRRMISPHGAVTRTDSDESLRRLTLFGWGAAVLAAIGLAWEVALLNDPARASPILRFYWFRLTDVAVPLAVALNLVAFIAAGLAIRRKWAAWAIAATVTATAWPLIHIVHQRSDNPVPPSDNWMASYDDWIDVCKWAAENTSPTSLFVTPRMNQSFKWRTGRPEVVSRKDIPQDAGGIVEWHERLHNIYYHVVDGLPVPVDSVADLGVEHTAAMAQKYSADYVIANRDPPLKLPMEYANNTYVVYRIKH